MRLAKHAVLTCLLVMVSAPAWAADGKQTCRLFAETLRMQMVAIIHNDKMEFTDKHKALEELFSKSVDMNAVGQYAAGSYWAEATPAERSAYLKAYSDYLPDFYVGNFDEDDLKGIIDVVITDFSQTAPNTYTAVTKITQSDDAPINAEFQLTDMNGKCTIHDFTAEGVSMMSMQREQMLHLGEKGGLSFITQKLEEHPNQQ